MTEPEIAVALGHDTEAADLPRVSASGRGAIARRIVQIARANRIEVRRDPDLAGMLQALEIDSPIPLAAFAAVAEILARLYRANGALAGDGR